MRKEYTDLITSVISNLIDRKDYFVENITDIATEIEYHSFDEKYDLSKTDIEEINKCRRYIIAIYKLIEDLEELKK